jgi:hypothetical protein
MKPGTSGYTTTVTSARSDKADAVEAAAQGDAALDLAAELSDRALREAETARRIAAMLAAQPVASDLSTASAARTRPTDDRLTVGCRTCDVTLSPPLRDPEEGARVARDFFARHGDCLTFVDLEPIRRVI